MTDAEKQSYFEDGYKARSQGFPEACNPHIPDMQEYEQWRQGWRNRNIVLAKKIAEGRKRAKFESPMKKPGER